jgi:hypothetical protein
LTQCCPPLPAFSGEHDFFFCRAKFDSNNGPSCDLGWTMDAAAKTLAASGVVPDKCKPYNPTSGSSACTATSNCGTAPAGKFSYVSYTSTLVSIGGLSPPLPAAAAAAAIAAAAAAALAPAARARRSFLTASSCCARRSCSSTS